MTTSDIEIEEKLESVYENTKTYESYIHRLRYLRDKIVKCDSYLTLLSTPNENYKTIREKYPNVSTRKNMLTAILSVFKNIEHIKSEFKSQHREWNMFHEHMDSFQKANYKKHMPSKEQLSKYTPLEDIEIKYKEMEKDDPHKTIKDSLQFILLSIIISTPPKRSDYGNLKIYYDEDPNDKTSNYVVIKYSNPSYIVFNQYKTKKYLGRVDQELPIKTTNDIKESLRRHPRDHLFITRYKKPFTCNKGFTVYFINTFEQLFGRKTGTTMLRHIYITERVSFDEMDDDQLESIAKQMLHSTTVQKKYNWNKKNICKTLKTMCPDN
jgi:hypothetical protein